MVDEWRRSGLTYPLIARAVRRYSARMIEFGIVMGIILAFILLLVGGLEAIDRWTKRAETAIDPQKVLEARFARGEIDEAEYARRLSVLRLGPPLEIVD